MSKPFKIAACLCVLLVAGGCSSEDIVDPNKLCKEGAGLGARIDGAATPVDMCVSNADTDAIYLTAPNEHYEITGTFVSGGLNIVISSMFSVYSAWPVQLLLTPSLGLAQSDPNYVYFSYREMQGGQGLQSMNVSGNFTLTFSDASIAVASFSDLTVTLEDVSSPGSAVATRLIPEGFLSVSAD